MNVVKPYEARRAISQSLRCGAAQVIRDARMLSDDPAEHARLLTQRGLHAQLTDHPAVWADIVNGMSRLVFRVAATYFHHWESHLPAQASFDDVFNAGMEGLVVGVKRFDPDSAHMLSTYATHWIRERVQIACYTQCGSARIPKELLKKGLDPMSPLVAAATMSLEHVNLEDGDELGASIDSGERIDAGLTSGEGVLEIIEILASVDEQLPEIAGLIIDGLGDGKIGKLTGMSAHRVAHLRALAQEALLQRGYAPGLSIPAADGMISTPL